MRHREQGFTLIEVMVVIIMIGVLAAVAIPIYSGYVYRARAAEGIALLGTIKTFAMEYRTSRGSWPTLAILNDEFHNFTELYYFDPETVDVFEQGDRFAIQVQADDTNFGLSEEEKGAWMQVDISLIPSADGTDTGWSGGIVEKYAHHLPPCSSPLTS